MTSFQSEEPFMSTSPSRKAKRGKGRFPCGRGKQTLYVYIIKNSLPLPLSSKLLEAMQVRNSGEMWDNICTCGPSTLVTLLFACLWKKAPPKTRKKHGIIYMHAHNWEYRSITSSVCSRRAGRGGGEGDLIPNLKLLRLLDSSCGCDEAHKNRFSSQKTRSGGIHVKWQVTQCNI